MGIQTVLLLDDDEALLETFKMVIESLPGYTTCVAQSLIGVQSLGKQALACDLAMLDINLGPDQPTGIDVYHWLRSQGFDKRVVFFTGHALSHPLIQGALKTGNAKAYSKPMPMDQFVKIVLGEPCDAES